MHIHTNVFVVVVVVVVVVVRIEKSRTIFPSMVRAAEECPKGSRLNWEYFFQLLFTRVNLKLVHISCHIKGEHGGCECQKRQFYTKMK